MFRRIVIAYAAHHYDVLMKKNMVMIEATYVPKYTYVYFDMCYDLLVLKMLSVSLRSVTYQFPGWEHALTPRANNRGWARETERQREWVSEWENRPRNGFMPIQARDSLHNNRWKIALLLIFIFIRNDNRFSRIHCNPRSYVPLHIACVCVYVCKYLYSDVNNNVVMYFLCWSIDFDV